MTETLYGMVLESRIIVPLWQVEHLATGAGLGTVAVLVRPATLMHRRLGCSAGHRLGRMVRSRTPKRIQVKFGALWTSEFSGVSVCAHVRMTYHDILLQKSMNDVCTASGS